MAVQICEIEIEKEKPYLTLAVQIGEKQIRKNNLPSSFVADPKFNPLYVQGCELQYLTVIVARHMLPSLLLLLLLSYFYATVTMLS